LSLPDVTELNFDHYDAAYVANPYPTLAKLREQCPIAHSEAHEGFWIATRYDAIRELIQDTDTFSSRYSSVPKDIGFGDFCVPPLHLDPPEHTRSKQLLATAFTRSRAGAFTSQIRGSVIELLDGFAGRDTFDLSYDFARLVPTAVVCHLVGRPGELDRFSGWVQRLLEQAATDIEDARAAALEMFTFLHELVQERRADPGDDVISMLVEAEVDGDRLKDEEIVFTAVLLVLAGIDTTWSTLAAAILHLATNPEDQQRLRDHPELTPTAREEFLRAFAPVTVGRVVKHDTEFGGRQLREGEMVLVSFPSANRDEAAFDDADAVKLDREPNRHMAFGLGIHRCLGIHVARMELTIALEELLSRIPPFTLADEDVHWTLGQVRGPKRILVTTAAPPAPA
jgi:hypothetical protein